MSIFIKTCPECAQRQPVAATKCQCGYRFDAHAHGASERLEIETIAEEEKLYQEYLEARAAQSKHDLDVARTAQLSDPGDKTKTSNVLRAKQALTVVQQELSEQSTKTQTVMATARKAREALPKKPEKPRVPKLQPEVVPLQPISAIAPTKLAAPTEHPPVKRPVAPVVPVTTAVTVTPPQKPPQKTALVRRAKFAKRAPEVPAVVPNATFRATLAAKAEKALRQFKEAARAKMRATQASQPKVKAQPSPSKPAPVRLVPPLKVPDTSPLSSATVQSATKECPNCTATVTESVNRCRCGYDFPNNESELPGIPLSAGELSILANGINPGISGRHN